MNIVINLIIFIIVLFLYLHITFQLKINNDLEILEIENPTKEQLEDICDLRQPVLFEYNNKIIEDINLKKIQDGYSAFDIKIRKLNDNQEDTELYLPLTLKETIILFEKDSDKKYFSENNKEFLEETSIIKNFNSDDLFLRPSFVSLCMYDLLIGYPNIYTPLRYDIYYRNYFLVTEGKIIIRLTPPKNYKYLDVFRDYEIIEFRSNIDIWNVQEKYKNDYEKIKCLDIELTAGQIIYIPAYWFYSIKYIEKSTICNFKYSTFMNNFAILPEYIMHILQNNNTKRKIADIKKMVLTDSKLS
jgi:hypothetical protein